MEESLQNRSTVRRKPVSIIIRTAVAAVALGFVLWNQSWHDLLDVFTQLNWIYFGLALLVFAGSQVIVAFRWWVLVRVQGIALGIVPAIRLHFLGLFYNNIMPGSVGGDLLRAWYVAKHTHKRVEAALSVFIDRVVGLSGVFVMATVAYLFLMKGMAVPGREIEKTVQNTATHRVTEEIASTAPWIILALAVVLVVMAAVAPLRKKLLGGFSLGFHKGILLLSKSKASLRIYGRYPSVLLSTLGLTLLLQSCTILAFWLLGRQIGIDAGIKYYFVIFPATWVVGALPISIAGLGVVEGGITILFEQFAGVADTQALCLALCQRFIWLLCSLPGGVIHLLGGHLPRSFSFDDRCGRE